MTGMTEKPCIPPPTHSSDLIPLHNFSAHSLTLLIPPPPPRIKHHGNSGWLYSIKHVGTTRCTLGLNVAHKPVHYINIRRWWWPNCCQKHWI